MTSNGLYLCLAAVYLVFVYGAYQIGYLRGYEDCMDEWAEEDHG